MKKNRGPYIQLRWLERLLLGGLVLSFVFPLSVSVRGVDLYVFDPVLVSMLVVWGARVVFVDHTVTLQYHDLLLYSVVVWIATSAVFALNRQLAFAGLALWIRVAVLFTVVRDQYGIIYDKRDIVTIAAVLLCVQVVVATVQGVTQTDIGALNQYFGTRESVKSFSRVGSRQILRAQGTLGSPNTVASWIVTLLPLVATAAAVVKDGLHRRVLVGLLALSVVALSFTLSRGAMAILLVLGAASLLSTPRVLRVVRHVPLLLLSFALAGAAFFALNPVRLFTIGKSISKRLELTDIAIRLVQRSPLFGVGYDNFVIGFRTLLAEDLFVRSRTTGVHNIPLLFAAETGLIGAVLFLAVGASVFRTLLITNLSQDWDDAFARGSLLSALAVAGVAMVYLTPTSFQYLPLAVVVLASGVGMCSAGTHR